MKTEKLNLKYLLRAHTVIGLVCVFLFYISSYFGAFTLFLPYIQIWETPSKHIKHTVNYEFNIDKKLEKIINEYKFNTKNIEITPPNFKDPRIQISSKNQNSVFLNPNTNEILDTKNEQKTVSTFFNMIHFGGNIPIVGRVMMGIASICILFLIISGIMIFFLNKKKKANERKSFKRTWYKWHKYLGLFLAAFIFIFAITGAFLGFMLTNSAPFALTASNFEKSSLRPLVSPIIFKQKELLKEDTNISKMQDLSFLILKAKENYKNLHIDKINIYNFNKSNSQIHFRGHLTNNKALTGPFNKVFITLNSNTAEVIEKKQLEQTHIINKVMSAFYFLHFLPDETILLRTILFILSIFMIICLVFGYLIWAEKKLKHQNDLGYFNFLNRFCIAIMIGVIPASCFVIFLHWLLPFETYDREIWIQGCFYILWAFTLFYSMYESSITKIFKLFFLISIILIVCAVLLHGLKTELYFWISFQKELYALFLVDIIFLFFALILLFLYFYIEKLEVFKRLHNEEFFYYEK